VATLDQDPRYRIYLPAPVVPTHALNRALLGWWQVIPGLDGGSRLLSLLDKFPAALTAASWMPTVRPGGFGQLDFTGGSGTATIANSASGALNFTTGSFTIGFWLKGSANTAVFVFKQVGSLGYQIVGSAPTIVSFTIFDGANTATANALTAIDGNWHHALMVVNRETQLLRAFADGKLAQSVSTTLVGTLSNASTLRFGNAGGAVSMDAVRIWNRPLSDREVWEESRLSSLGYPGVLARANPSRGVASSSYITAALAASAGGASMAASLVANPAAPSSAALAATAGSATMAGSLIANLAPPCTAALAATAGPATIAATAYFLPIHVGKQPNPRRSEPTPG
jgi:hypothetical protein